jgi:hypothetical protein
MVNELVLGITMQVAVAVLVELVEMQHHLLPDLVVLVLLLILKEQLILMQVEVVALVPAAPL